MYYTGLGGAIHIGIENDDLGQVEKCKYFGSIFSDLLSSIMIKVMIAAVTS